jgi:VCBS repeat-containing protein
VIGGSSGSYIAAAAQLEDSTAFSIDADPISAKAFTTQDQWAALIENYDVVVLGDSGSGTDYGATPLFPALRGFVDAGGGVVTSGWFAYIFPTLSGTARADADYITPIGTQTYKYAAKNSTITIVDPSHPITDGIASYKVNATAHELGGGVDADATVLARGASGSTSLPAIVVDEVGQGRTAYFGSLQMANPSTYSLDRVAGGAVDQIFERVVAWAAGTRDVYAATDEDTPLGIDAAALLANDGDIENDALAIGAVSAKSALGATVSLGAAGSILYDPTAALQYLKPGQVVTDSFDYAVVDGHGGTDIATVSLSVAGRADIDALL